MSNTGQAEGPSMCLESKNWVVNMEINVDSCKAKGPAMSAELKNWVDDIKTGVESLSLSNEEKKWRATSIYRVPSFIRNKRQRAFTPTVVSFGPYHHGAPELRPVEEHKRRALIHFLKMTSEPLECFIEAMRIIEKKLQDSYHNLDEEWKDPKHPDKFLMLMILDGCFMLEVMRMEGENWRKWRYATHDPVFSSYGVDHRLPYIKRDMLVMENQLPLLVLKKLLEVEGGQCAMDDASINNMVLKFLGEESKITVLGLHPLDVYRKTKLLGAPPNQSSEGELEVLMSAKELHQSGVKFRKSRTPSLADIHFKDGVLSLPLLVVDDTTECMLLNIVAFEHLHVGTSSGVTSYVCFMDEVIDSAEDVSLLQRKGITKVTTGSNETVAKLFGSLSEEVTRDSRCRLRQVRSEVNKYCKNKWNTWRADLLRKYFHNPWSLIALIGAIVAIVLTAIQTFYPFFKH